jgi:FkbM family methyltransferase
MASFVSTFGRRFYKLTQLIEQPRLWRLHRDGVEPESYRLFNHKWLKGAGINTVLDIGANTGQFAKLIHAVLPQAAIYSFEPLPECYRALLEQTTNLGKVTAFNVGLGSAEGTMTFYRNQYTDSSSFRPMLETCRQQFPFTSGDDTPLDVPVRTLDSYQAEITWTKNVLVKIDVQGYEDEVIRGGSSLLAQAYIVIMEISFVPLYQGSPSFDSLYTRMRELGFEFKGLLGQLFGPLDGAILQGDALFIKTAPP